MDEGKSVRFGLLVVCVTALLWLHSCQAWNYQTQKMLLDHRAKPVEGRCGPSGGPTMMYEARENQR